MTFLVWNRVTPGNQAAHSREDFLGVHPSLGVLGPISIGLSNLSRQSLVSTSLYWRTSDVVTLTSSVQVEDEKMSTKFITIFSFTSALTLHYIVLLILSVAVCSSGCFQGPPLPNKPFITVWNTPTDQCKPKWNVSLDLSAFDIVVNKDQKWCGEYIVIFYNTQLGLYPYFDSNGKTFNGGLPQVVDLFL